MKNKKGISLIVLVITIIVIILLAGAIILAMNKNNPIANSKKATVASNIANMQSAYTAYLGKRMAEEKCSISGNGIILSENIRSSLTATYKEVVKDEEVEVSLTVEGLGITKSNIASIKIENNKVVSYEEVINGNSIIHDKINEDIVIEPTEITAQSVEFTPTAGWNLENKTIQGALDYLYANI